MIDPAAEVASWTEYRVYLMKTLERLEGLIRELNAKLDSIRRDGHDEVSALRKELNALEIEFGMQKVKMGLIGTLAGAIMSALISYLMKGH